jgi:glycosyltransferase involved in cell wall biosynthesis
MASLLHYLVNAGCSVTLFSFANHPTEPWVETAQLAFEKTFPTVRLVLDTQTALLRWLTFVKNAVTSFIPARARQILGWRYRGASPNYEALAAESSDAIWILNYTDGLTQLNGVSFAQIVIETHDLKFLQVAKRDCKPPFNFRSLLRMRSEIGVLNCASAVIAISPVEAGFFRTVLTGPETYYIPRYGSSAAVRRADRPKEGYRYDLVFVGSEMFQNVRGLSAFLESSKPWLSSLRIAVAGRVCEDSSIRELIRDWPNVSLLGFVEDLAAVYAASKAAISPVDGTGLKIKATEALSYGLPVFGSRHSIEGLAAGYDRCVFPIERAYIEHLLFDEVALEEAQTAALSYWGSLGTAGDLKEFQSFLHRAPNTGDEQRSTA